MHCKYLHLQYDCSIHCEKESTRVFGFGIEVRTDGIEVRDYSSQEMMKLGKLKVRFISYFITVFSFMYTNCWYSNNSERDESIISYYIAIAIPINGIQMPSFGI